MHFLVTIMSSNTDQIKNVCHDIKNDSNNNSESENEHENRNDDQDTQGKLWLQINNFIFHFYLKGVNLQIIISFVMIFKSLQS